MSETANHDRPEEPKGDRVAHFPRGVELSNHSPLFWVNNKDRFLRQLMISDIEKLTGRRLCVYFCSSFFRTSLTTDDVGRLYEVLNTDKCGPFDLMLETSGGETDATEALVSMISSINDDFRVIVPSRAKSNGTMICLAARSVVMGITSELGPIEPTLGERPVSLLMTEEYKKHSFPLYEAGTNAFKQTQKLAKQLLSKRLPQKNEGDIDQILEKLCTRMHFHSHGSVINASEAETIGLVVNSLDNSNPLWKRIWLLYNMYVHDSSMWSVGKYYEGRTLSHVIEGDDPIRSEGST